MKPLSSHWRSVEERLARARRCLFLFDFDGTLAPIRAHPKDVHMRLSIKRALLTLSKSPDCAVGVVSGRPLQDLRRRVGIPGLLYVGNHGFEIQEEHKLFVHPKAYAKTRSLQQLSDDITAALEKIPGAWSEFKEYTLSIHFRQTPAVWIEKVRKTVHRLLQNRKGADRFILKEGNKVIEILPVRNWHKGSSVKRIRRTEPAGTCVFYIGDDATDEDAFGVLSKADVSVRVGRSRRTLAQFSIRNQASVHGLLQKLILFVRRRAGDSKR